MNREDVKLFRGAVFDFTDNPVVRPDGYRWFPDGGLVVSDGRIVSVGAYQMLKKKYPDVDCEDYSGKLIMPGFIDTHIHFPQMEIIGSYGKQLLEWLNGYTFAAEMSFADTSFAQQMAGAFLAELFRNGTTACMVYPAVFKQSAEVLFEAASKVDMLLLTGKVLMNRNAPAALTDEVGIAEKECRELIQDWHGKGRNRYVLTPRFAISCDETELRIAASLHQEFPDTYIQTHLSENEDEIATVRRLFPDAKDYLDVYEKNGLLTDRTVFAHGIHLSDSEWSRIAAARAVIAHCPTSNLFLGSGLFDMRRANQSAVCTTIATDVGGGTSFSLLKTLGEAYKVQQLKGYPMTALEGFYKATLGAAVALHLEDRVGNFDEGKEADFVVIDYRRPVLQQLRMDYMQRKQRWTIQSLLFGLQTLGDDRNIVATYIRGKPVYLQNRI